MFTWTIEVGIGEAIHCVFVTASELRVFLIVQSSPISRGILIVHVEQLGRYVGRIDFTRVFRLLWNYRWTTPALLAYPKTSKMP
jgi:hypothetical protein